MSLVVYLMLQAEEFKSAGNGLKYVLQLIPHFSITFGFMRFSDLVLKNNRCRIKTISCPGDDVCCRKFVHYLSHLLVMLNYMFTEMLMTTYGSFIVNYNFNYHPTSCFLPGHFHICQKVITVFLQRTSVVFLKL
jgi:hypothetical protein